MDTPITVSFSPLQMILSLAFQVWIIVFPILIIRKLNYLTSLLEKNNESVKSDDDEEDASV